jgi:TIR domain
MAVRFDAFLSYAHEDRDTVAWLHRLLRLFWVPGKRRRNLFLDEFSLSAGPLTDGLRQALRDSRYLIVCCSEASARSKYVDLEIEEFLKTRARSRGEFGKS